ncbi:MAG: aminotransferase class I/II-fold pyridoxal phosphate-dependent enzyme [Planctomycetota bacterium]|nr:MAG: aminotransferase class I/II-fold pyridoxal phosphate-dependent enzyme [Planctomycetota bacterium]
MVGEGRSAALLVDEAHAVGVVGPGGAGLCAETECRADVIVFTASKALGAQGGVVAGPAIVREALANFARPFLYTTGTAPPLAAAVATAAGLVREAEERRRSLRAVAQRLRAGLVERGWRLPGGGEVATPILPLLVEAEERALALSARLAQAGFAAPAIRPPTVAPGAARVRLSLHSGVSEQDVQRLVETVGEASSWRSSSRA